MELAGTVLSVLKDRQPLQSLSGNFMVFKHTIPQQLERPDGIFMTKANYSLVIVTPK